MFGVTRQCAEKIIEVCIWQEPKHFHKEGWKDALGKAIPAHMKVLCVLKIVRFGTSMVAFRDDFQMGESTILASFHAMFHAMASDEELLNTYLSTMTRVDAERAARLHKEAHGVDGMALSLDCCHIKWKNCPVAWQGQFEGKEGEPTIVLEAAVDHDLYFWHAAFGYPGMQNDLIIWEQSPLLEMLENGYWSTQVDPLEEFVIGNKQFSKLWFLVDGIYPPLSRFMKTISDPSMNAESRFAEWQEGSQKDVERAFGVWQSKFHILTQKIELWNPEEIKNMVIGTIIMHNMMVQHRQALGTSEDPIHYAINDAIAKQLSIEILKDKEMEEVLASLGISEDPASAGGEVINDEKTEIEVLMEKMLMEKRVTTLNDINEHRRLRNAVIAEISK
jgi:hypothetical protein